MNFSKVIIMFCCTTLLISCNQKNYVKPVNKNATGKTIALYNFLQDIQGKYTLSGQHNFINSGSKYTNQFEEVTGKSPIVWGSDFSWCAEGETARRFSHCGPLNLSNPDTEFEFLDVEMAEVRENMVKEIQKKHSEGHIITLMWHGCYPTDGDCCEGSSIWAMENRPSPEEWDKLVTEGTELNTAWKEGADKIADYLNQLQELDIPVLWRPYHEMNGVWFWWCNQKGDQGFKRLWIMMYDYFTNHHKLNNLIWVWNTNAPRDIPGDEAWPYEDFYPGDEYVDVLAADVYRKDYKQTHHDDLLALAKGKPIALGEVGEVPTSEIIQQQPYWTWYMPWGYLHFRLNDNEAIKELALSEQVLTLDEIEFNGKGEFTVK